MFYEKGIDISNNKSMFNFLNEHFRYATLNTWNRLFSIANNVKVYNLRLTGDEYAVLRYLNKINYQTINDMIDEWEYEHPGYTVGFNGRSAGYIVLYNKGNMASVIPEELDGYDTYEDWKSDIKGWGYNVSDFHDKLVELTKLVQDFDKLCDKLRDYCDKLSTRDLLKDVIEENVICFNELYEDDLKALGIPELVVDEKGRVDATKVARYHALYDALLRILDERESGFEIEAILIEPGDFVYVNYKG